MDMITKMEKGEIEALVDAPNVVVAFKVAENAFIRAAITPDGELYLNGSWGTLFVRPDSANTCFVSILPVGTRLVSQAVPEGPEGGT